MDATATDRPQRAAALSTQLEAIEHLSAGLGHDSLSLCHHGADFAERDGGTEMTLTQTRFGSESLRDAHERGWTSAFEALEESLPALG